MTPILPLMLMCLHTASFITLVALIYLDPFFYYGVGSLLVKLRCAPAPPFKDRGLNKFSKLGWRMLLTAILFVAALWTAAAFFAWQVINWSDRLIPTIFCWSAIVPFWIFLWMRHRDIHSCGTMRRVHAAIPQAAQLAAQLNKFWPPSNGELPWAGEFTTDTGSPDLLLVRNTISEFPLRESCGMFIQRDLDGIIRFDLRSRIDIEMKLEFFFNGSRPASFTDVFDGFTIDRELKGEVQLRPDVWLTWYDSDFSNVNERGAETMLGVLQKLGDEMVKHGGCKGACGVRASKADVGDGEAYSLLPNKVAPES